MTVRFHNDTDLYLIVFLAKKDDSGKFDNIRVGGSVSTGVPKHE